MTRLPTPEERVRRDEPRNAKLYTIDGVCWWVGTAFTDAATVLPAFLSQLGGSNALIGLLTGFRTGGYLLPQLAVAHYVERWQRKKPLVVVNSLVQRLALLAIALLVLRHAVASPSLVLGWFVALYMIACVSEGVNAVPWTDILAKSVHPLRRGRLYGRMQSWGGLLAFAAGYGVHRILTHPRLPYPGNYALLFALTAVAYAGSYAAFLLVREPVLAVDDSPRPSLAGFLGRLPGLWRSSPDFARLAVCRVLLGFSHLPAPFYVLYSVQALGLGPGVVGLYIACQMAGNVGGGLLWGRLGDSRGNRAVIRLVCLCAIASPALALAAGQGYAGLPPATLFMLVFVFLGLTYAGAWIGFTNYLLELVPATRRPSYLGLLNTLAGPASLLPAAGGLVVDVVGYKVLFGLSALVLVVAGSRSLALREPRQDRVGAAEKPTGGAVAGCP